MMHLVLFIVYLCLICLAITRMRFFRGFIRPAYLLGLFGLHVAAGCIHNWVAFHYFPAHGDIWYFFEESVEMKKLLLSQPRQFFSGMVAGNKFNITDTSQPLMDIQYKILQYLNVLFNFVSFNNFYINTLLFSFPVFAGTVALFKAFFIIFKSALPALCTLLLPSVLFWTSVFHKDSIFYMSAGYFFYYLLLPDKKLLRKWALLLLFTVLMGLSRANALVTLLPALLFLLLTEKRKMAKWKGAGITLLVVAFAALLINVFMNGQLLAAICERQHDFQSLQGGSKLYLPLLSPTAGSFSAVFPVALLNGFFQPLPGAGGKLIYTLFTAELIFVWALVMIAGWLGFRIKTTVISNFDYSFLVFALAGMIIIGYMVPFAGAIIRYRSIYLPFLLAPFLNILSRYPANPVQSANAWLCRNLMLGDKAGSYL